MITKRRALFLDRDGIINEDFHYAYKPEHITFREKIFELCGKAQKLGYLLIVVTNQAGVAKGKFTEQDVLRLHEWMKGEFAKRGVDIAAFYYCPYHAEGTVKEYRKNSDYRKPKPGMIFQASKEHNLDLSRSLMIGDNVSDRIEIPELRSLIIKSEYTNDDDYDLEDLSEVSKYLVPEKSLL